MSDTQVLATQAIKASQEGHWEDGRAANEQILEQEPSNIGALNRLAFCFMQLGDMNQAKKQYCPKVFGDD